MSFSFGHELGHGIGLAHDRSYIALSLKNRIFVHGGDVGDDSDRDKDQPLKIRLNAGHSSTGWAYGKIITPGRKGTR